MNDSSFCLKKLKIGANTSKVSRKKEMKIKAEISEIKCGKATNDFKKTKHHFFEILGRLRGAKREHSQIINTRNESINIITDPIVIK